MEWNDGYVSDIAYPAAFFPEQSPTHLSLACILHGVEPVPLDRPFTYFELGAGMGLTANVLAASHPHGRFYANDFQPAHVASARQLADEAGLDNITFLEASFADLAAGRVELPPLDFITMYGVYSWVTAENRARVVEFIARYLKPGGIVYVNYNAMPGWTNALPLQRLILEHAERHPAPRAGQVDQARRFVDTLMAGGAAYFDGNAQLQHRLDSLGKDKLGYLAHEYMNRGWEPRYHADVVREMAAAKLDYVGPAELARAWPELFETERQQAVLDGVADGPLRETLRDYQHNTSFREDVLVRGARAMGRTRQEQWLRQMGLALTAVRGAAGQTQASLKLPGGMQRAAPDAELHLPLLDALAGGPMSLVALAALPALRGKTLLEIARMGALLTVSGQLSCYFLSGEEADPAPARRLNRAIAEQALLGDHYQALASPMLGNGMRSGLVQRLIYRLLAQLPEGAVVDRDAITESVAETLREQGRPFDPDGAAAIALNQLLRELPQTVAAILAQRLPIWRASHM